MLGGGCNFEADRIFAHELVRANPNTERAMLHNRAFLGRAVRFCVEQGIRQFLDLGSGIPTVGNVHEIAQRADPECRVVYVDHEPIAVAHSELILDGNDRADVLLANLLDVGTVLNSEQVRRLVDFSQPMAVILAAVLHFVPDDANPHAVVARYVEAMAPGSFLVVSHGRRTEEQDVRSAWRLYDQSSTPARGRTRDEVEAFLAGTDLVSPGVVWTSQWRPEFDPEAQDGVYAAVGRKPLTLSGPRVARSG
jgi:hypothetical protein